MGGGGGTFPGVCWKNVELTVSWSETNSGSRWRWNFVLLLLTWRQTPWWQEVQKHVCQQNTWVVYSCTSPVNSWSTSAGMMSHLRSGELHPHRWTRSRSAPRFTGRVLQPGRCSHTPAVDLLWRGRDPAPTPSCHYGDPVTTLQRKKLPDGRRTHRRLQRNRINVPAEPPTDPNSDPEVIRRFE